GPSGATEEDGGESVLLRLRSAIIDVQDDAPGVAWRGLPAPSHHDAEIGQIRSPGVTLFDPPRQREITILVARTTAHLSVLSPAWTDRVAVANLVVGTRNAPGEKLPHDSRTGVLARASSTAIPLPSDATGRIASRRFGDGSTFLVPSFLGDACRPSTATRVRKVSVAVNGPDVCMF